MVPEITNLPYRERLKHLKFPTMAYRRARGDMIEVYKLFMKYMTAKQCSDNILKLETKYSYR